MGNDSVPVQESFSGNLSLKAGGTSDAGSWGGAGSLWGVLVRESSLTNGSAAGISKQDAYGLIFNNNSAYGLINNQTFNTSGPSRVKP